jgi:hypothetical protein
MMARKCSLFLTIICRNLAHPGERFTIKPTGVINSLKVSDYIFTDVSWLIFNLLDDSDEKLGLDNKAFF